MMGEDIEEALGPYLFTVDATDVIRIKLRDGMGPVFRTESVSILDPIINVDYDHVGNAVGVEIL